jgi:hypothetical protein
LKRYASYLQAVRNHVDAHPVLVSGFVRRLPFSLSADEDWSRQQKTTTEPIRLVFLRSIMRPQEKLHVFRNVHSRGAVSEKHVSQFVHQVARLAGLRVFCIYDDECHRTVANRHSGPTVRIFHQQTFEAFRGKTRNFVRTTNDHAMMIRQIVWIETIKGSQAERRPFLDRDTFAPALEATFKHRSLFSPAPR